VTGTFIFNTGEPPPLIPPRGEDAARIVPLFAGVHGGTPLQCYGACIIVGAYLRVSPLLFIT